MNHAHVEKPRIVDGLVLSSQAGENQIPQCEAEAVGRKWRQLVETRRSPSPGSSSHVEAKVRMWFPTLWRP